MVKNQQLTIVYQQNFDWLIALIHHRVKTIDLAQDLAQDTFERLLRRPTHVLSQEQDKLRAYLSTIAKGLVVDNWRRHEIEQRFLQQLAVQQVILEESEQLVLLDNLYIIDQLVRQLNPKIRLSFIYVHVYGMTYKEVACQLNLTERTIKNYMAQAMLHCLQQQAKLSDD